MLRRALLLSVALAAVLGPSDAWATRTTIAVSGDVLSIGRAGDDLVVARELRRGGGVVERRAPGAAVQRLLRLPSTGDETFVAVAASSAALAIAIYVDDEEENGTPGNLVVGPPGGPLHAITTCSAGLASLAVAVSGPRIAWTEGGCVDNDNATVSPLSLALGRPDTAAPIRRIAIAGEALPSAIVLNGAAGLIGLTRPSFFLLRSEVRPIGPAGLGPPIVSKNNGILTPLGILGNGDAVVSLEEFDDEDGSEGCTANLVTIASATGQRQALKFGGCPGEQGLSPSTSDAAVLGDRVYAVVERENPSEGFTRAALASVRGDGTGRRDHVRGTYRPPEAVAPDASGRLTWWQRRCAGGTEIVTEDQPGSARVHTIPSCSAKVLTRSARVRNRRITVRLRCAHGCRGWLSARHRSGRPRFLRPYNSGTATTLRLRVHLNRRERRASRLRLVVHVDHGSRRSAVIRLR